MSDSIWKKEISFGRKPKEPKAAAEPKQSLLKKEISFGRKPKAGQPVAAQTVEPKQSIWKKEVSLGRKPKVEQPVAAQVVEPKQSIWKKEVSLGRKKRKDEEAVARLVEAAAQSVAPEFVPVLPEPVAAQPVAAPTQIAEAVLAAEPTPEPAPEQADVHPVEVLPVDAPAAYAPPVADVPVVPAEPVVELPVAPVADAPAAPVAPAVTAEPVVELPVAPVAEAPAAPAEPVVELPVDVPAAPAQQPPAESAYHVETAPVEGWMEPAAAEPWLAEPELPPAPVAETTQVVLHPPVAASELPPLPEAKVPFWKKEISLGRKKSPPAVAAPVAAAVHPPVPAAELPPLPESKVPFWKKEIGGKKKAQAQPADKVPFWKKEIGGGKKTARSPKQPRAKKSLALPQVSLPSLGGGKAKSGHQVKRLVGLKVGGSQLAAARIANNGAAELLQVARADLDPGVVVSGELRDPDTLAEALKAFFAANKLPRKNVRLGIASNRIGVRTFDIAGIEDPKQLENAIQFRAQEALPIPLDEAVLDYQILEERRDEEGTLTKRVLLVVAYRELVDRYVAACRKAGITLSGIDLEAFALLRALSAPRPQDEPTDSALVAVAIGHDRSTFAVSDGRVCEFTRVLDWGGASLNVAIARALNLAPSETEGIKRAVSLASTDVPEGIAPEHYAPAVDAVRKQVQTFARELVSSLQFYQNQPGSLGIGEIVITGGTASLAGLSDELQRLIGVRVRVGDPLARLKLTKKVAVGEQLGSLAVAIGLGIED